MFRRADFSQICIFEKSWSKCKHASAQRCHDGRSHALLEYVGLAAMCHALSARESGHGMGYPPRAGPFGCRRFFAHFCMTLEHLLFKRQIVEEKSAENLCKNLRKNLRTKICAKMGAKICAPKICAKMGAKICTPLHTKICAKNRFEHSICLDGSQKKTQKKLRQTCAKPQPLEKRVRPKYLSHSHTSQPLPLQQK